MGTSTAREAVVVLRNVETVVGSQLICAAQALEFLSPVRPGESIGAALALVRERVPPLGADRVLSGDIQAVAGLVRTGAFSEL